MYPVKIYISNYFLYVAKSFSQREISAMSTLSAVQQTEEQLPQSSLWGTNEFIGLTYRTPVRGYVLEVFPSNRLHWKVLPSREDSFQIVTQTEFLEPYTLALPKGHMELRQSYIPRVRSH